MDDDLTFGASVWGSVDSPIPPLTIKPPPPDGGFGGLSPGPSTQDDFDDFDAFGTPAETAPGSENGGDDDFGDFGDFGDTQVLSSMPSAGFSKVVFSEPAPPAAPLASSRDWRALQLAPRESLQAQVDELLGALWAEHDGADQSILTDEPIREVGGLAQTLVTPESRQLYSALLPPAAPAFQPVNWTRSRIRRRHLIALGIPVNLDEVLPRGALPTLEITTRPRSAPPGPRGSTSKLQTSALANSGARGPGSQPPSPKRRAGAGAAGPQRLGPRPELDEGRIAELLGLSPERLSLLPASTLEAHLTEMKAQTAKTSALLTYLLQTRDELQQDSETYNKLIGELVGEAQKVKTGKRTTTRKGTT